MRNKRILVMISGSGSNLQAFIDAQMRNELGGEIVAVLSNKAGVFGLERAANAGIDTIVIPHQDYSSRGAFDQAMLARINEYQPDLIILAGFMRILSAEFVQNLSGKLLNIHPSLLPKYPGLNTHQKALDNRDELHGTSVHFVTEELDGGPLIAQSSLKLNHNDDATSVMQKIQTLEHQLYPKVAMWFLTERLKLQNDGVYFDNKKLNAPLQVS